MSKKKKISELTVADIRKQCKKGGCILADRQILYCIDCNLNRLTKKELEEETEV